MRTRFVIYPETQSRLTSSGLADRIEKASKDSKEFPNLYGAVHKVELPGLVADMRGRDFYKKAPKVIYAAYTGKLKKLFEDIESRSWIVKKSSEVREQAEEADFLLLSGYIASCILNKNEFWNFKKFGFESFFDFVGAIGAYAFKAVHKNWDKGYVWESEENGLKFKSEVTGDMNGDLRLFRKDMTPYETIDPLGNRVYYRPELLSEEQIVASYHSTEPALLATLLKYVEQEKVDSQILKDNAKDLLSEVRRLNQNLGAFADYGSDTWGPMRHFYNLDNIPRLDENNSAVEHSSYGLVGQSEQGYGIYVGHDGSLVFAMEKRSDPAKLKKEIAFRIPKNEVDHMIKGLFVQASRGLGRTLVQQLSDIVQYKFSEQFKKDQAELSK